MAVVKLSAHFTAKVIPGVTKVWEEIHKDIEFEQSNKTRPMTNKIAITESIEHSRLIKIARRPEVDELVLAAINDHGYDQVIDFLADRIPLYTYPAGK